MLGYQFSNSHAFIDIHLDIYGFLWISIHRLAMDSRAMDRRQRQAWLRLDQAPFASLRRALTRKIKHVVKNTAFDVDDQGCYAHLKT